MTPVEPAKALLGYETHKDTGNKVEYTNDDLGTSFLRVFDSVRVAALPRNYDSIIAVIGAEAAAGFIGALASRQVATVLGDNKRDSDLTKARTTATFFGTRGALRVGGRLLGLPRPLAYAFASVLAGSASEATKFASRRNDIAGCEGGGATAPQRPLSTRKSSRENSRRPSHGSSQGTSVITKEGRRERSAEQVELMTIVAEKEAAVEEDETLPAASVVPAALTTNEFVVDITRWVVYDFLTESLPFPSDQGLQFLEYFGCGAVSYITGLVAELGLERGRNKISYDEGNEREAESPVEYKSPTIRRVAFTALEGGVLFVTFQVLYEVCTAVLPHGLQERMTVDFVLETVETTIGRGGGYKVM